MQAAGSVRRLDRTANTHGSSLSDRGDDLDVGAHEARSLLHGVKKVEHRAPPVFPDKPPSAHRGVHNWGLLSMPRGERISAHIAEPATATARCSQFAQDRGGFVPLLHSGSTDPTCILRVVPALRKVAAYRTPIWRPRRSAPERQATC